MPVNDVLNIVCRSHEGTPWAIPKEWADELIRNYNLVLTQRHYNMSGETSALFEYNGSVIRLEYTWTGRYNLYHGDWKPDPHWTGD